MNYRPDSQAGATPSAEILRQLLLGLGSPNPSPLTPGFPAPPSSPISPRLPVNSNPLSQNIRPHDPNRFAPYKNYDEYAKWLATTAYAQSNQQQVPSLSARDALLQQLFDGLNAGKPKLRSIEDLRKDARKQAGLQFDPQIETIKQLMGDAKLDAKTNSKELKALYADLAGSYGADNSWLQKELSAAKKDELASLETLQGGLDEQYGDQTAEMQSEFEKLGIADALPGSTKQMKSDNEFLSDLNNTASTAQQQFYDSLSAENDSYYTKGAGNARQRGVESIEDLMGNLQSYLDEQGGQLSGLQGQKSSTLSQLLTGMQDSQNSAYGTWDSDRWSRAAQLLGLLNSSSGQDFDQQMQLMKLMQGGQGGGNPATEGIEGAYGVLRSLLGDGSGNAISALQNFLQTTTQREGSFSGANGQASDMTPQQAAFEARKYAAQLNLSPPEIDALVQAVYAYYGKLR